MKIFRDLPGYSAWSRIENAVAAGFEWCEPPKRIACIGGALVVLYFGIHLIARVE
jgi:hypothetical protein